MSRPDRIDPDTLVQLEERTKTMACPRCGEVGTLVIKEKYVLRADPPVSNARFEFGLHGMPLWACCERCGSQGRVAEVRRGGPPS